MDFDSETRTFAPSKRVTALIIVVVALIAAVALVQLNPSDDSGPQIALSGTKKTKEIPEVDTDNDGLADWEEVLWDLDPTKPDTDGDGVGDAEDVAKRQKNVSDIPSLFAQSTSTTGASSPTELAGRILVAQFLASKQAGITLDEESVELASKVALESMPQDRSYDLIGRDDLNISLGNQTLKDYGNAVGAAVLNKTNEPAPDELLVLLAYSQNPDSEKLANDMAGVIERYNTTIAGLLNIALSNAYADEHLALVNALIRVRTDLVDLSKVGDNPLIAIAALESYRTNSSVMTNLFEDLRAKLVDSTSVFLPQEPGYLFIHAADTTNQ